jgi:hypothetical protein
LRLSKIKTRNPVATFGGSFVMSAAIRRASSRAGAPTGRSGCLQTWQALLHE